MRRAEDSSEQLRAKLRNATATSNALKNMKRSHEADKDRGIRNP